MLKINFSSNNGQSPKILINLKTFVNFCFKRSPYNLIYGTRFNIIKKDFENILEMMKSAGAELFFVSKSAQSTQESQKVIKKFNKRSKSGLKFLSTNSNDCVPKVFFFIIYCQRFISKLFYFSIPGSFVTSHLES